MSLTPSTMLPLGTKMPEFSLPTTVGEVTSEDLKNQKAVVVAFICNHCPYVKHIRSKSMEIVENYEERGVAFVAINSNDAQNYPDDSFENMKEVDEDFGYNFPYAFDETQEVAKDFKAACTPDIFVFDEGLRLVYRGQMDDSRPGSSIPVTGTDLKEALEAVLSGEEVSEDQRPSTGCNIKWKPGNEPEYY